MSRSNDHSYRPDTYWPESRTPEQLLARIKGQVRRDIARRVLAERGFWALTAFVAREELDRDDAREWGGWHPWCLGGEYLPSLQPAEVEIARISLASTTYDQISVRARPGVRIRYRIVDEYQSRYTPGIQSSSQPLSLRQLIRLIDRTGAREGLRHGLVESFWWNEFGGGFQRPEKAAAFVSLESAFYPDLAAHYSAEAAAWVARVTAEEAEHDVGVDAAQVAGQGVAP